MVASLLDFLLLGWVCVVTSHDDHGHHGSVEIDLDAEPVNALRNSQFIRNADHISEHLKDQIKFDANKATPQELDFHFFKSHDFNSDNWLDGLELYLALDHVYLATGDSIQTDGRLSEGDRHSSLQRLKQHIADTVDKILEDDDLDNDGYLSYYEFIESRNHKRDIDV